MRFSLSGIPSGNEPFDGAGANASLSLFNVVTSIAQTAVRMTFRRHADRNVVAGNIDHKPTPALTQIGEAQAISVTVAGTSSGGSRPRRKLS